ncbi:MULTISPECIES: hypothetical protein [Bacillus cereus group]|uniref:hypothetical protein n=1 Tax=Bacillus cereus group TaxID=86661 RepID=UPI0001A10805|nr:hypothetical protein bcere0029_59990 [Bacillus cereus AH1272]EEL90516.1 hypothetical protein bcere0030_55640 [Bacillus cereus AH1273]
MDKELEKMRKLQQKIASYESDLKKLQDRAKDKEKKERTKRLIEQGAYGEILFGTNNKDKFISAFYNTYIKSKLFEKQNILLGFILGNVQDNEVHNFYQTELNRLKMKIDFVENGEGAKQTKTKRIKEIKTIEMKVYENAIGWLPIKQNADNQTKIQLVQKWEDRHRNRIEQL